MVLNEEVVKESEGRLGCICQLFISNSMHQVDMDVQVGDRLWNNQYRVYFKTNKHIYSYGQYKEELFKQCVRIKCAALR